MNKIAKIFLAASLAVVFGCSGKGEITSRLDNFNDPEENKNSENENSENSENSTTPKKGCLVFEDAVCIEMDDASINLCTTEFDGEVAAKCPANGKECKIDLDELKGFTVYTYPYEIYSASQVCEEVQVHSDPDHEDTWDESDYDY